MRAALILTEIIKDKELFAELIPTNDIMKYFQNLAIIAEYIDLIPGELKQNREMDLEAFLEWFPKIYYTPIFEVKTYSKLSPEYPDLLIQQYKKKMKKGGCNNDTILFRLLAKVNGFEVRQVYFIYTDGYGKARHAMVEL